MKTLISFLRFSRGELLGLIFLFILVFMVLFMPYIFPSPAASASSEFERIKHRIDSIIAANNNEVKSIPDNNTSFVKVQQPDKHHPTPIKKDTINYKPFVRSEAALPVVELNSADTLSLQLVRGIGSYYAKRIIKYRDQLGGFARIEQLLDIRGVDVERINQWHKQLKVDTSLIRKIELSTADEESLRQHPYIGYYTAKGIIHFRTTQGIERCTIDALVKNNILDDETGERLRAYLK